MNRPESAIIRPDKALDPRHEGIAAWQYVGNRERYGEVHTGPLSRDAVFNWATDVVSLTVDGAYINDNGEDISLGMRRSMDYGPQLREYARVEHAGYWVAHVVARGTRPGDLLHVQTALHERSQAYEAELATQGILDVWALHRLPHLHTVDPRVEQPGAIQQPVSGLWLPRLDEHNTLA